MLKTKVIYILTLFLYSCSSEKEYTYKKGAKYLDKDYDLLMKQPKGIRACVNTLNQGVYSNESLDWKLKKCNA